MAETTNTTQVDSRWERNVRAAIEQLATLDNRWVRAEELALHLASTYGVTPHAVAHHVLRLQRAGVIEVTRSQAAFGEARHGEITTDPHGLVALV